MGLRVRDFDRGTKSKVIDNTVVQSDILPTRASRSSQFNLRLAVHRGAYLATVTQGAGFIKRPLTEGRELIRVFDLQSKQDTVINGQAWVNAQDWIAPLDAEERETLAREWVGHIGGTVQNEDDLSFNEWLSRWKIRAAMAKQYSAPITAEQRAEQEAWSSIQRRAIAAIFTRSA